MGAVSTEVFVNAKYYMLSRKIREFCRQVGSIGILTKKNKVALSHFTDLGLSEMKLLPKRRVYVIVV